MFATKADCADGAAAAADDDDDDDDGFNYGQMSMDCRSTGYD